MKYQRVTVTETTGKKFSFVCPTAIDAHLLQSVEFGEFLDAPPEGIPERPYWTKKIATVLSTIALNLYHNLKFST